MRRAKREVEDVMTDLSKEVSSRFESAVPIETSVADTTPVSSAARQHCPSHPQPRPRTSKQQPANPRRKGQEQDEDAGLPVAGLAEGARCVDMVVCFVLELLLAGGVGN